MASGRDRRRALARAKWERQQQRRTAAQQRNRRLSIIGGAAAAVVAAGALGYGGYALVNGASGGSPGTPHYTDNFPTLLQPTNPGVTAFSYSPGKGGSKGAPLPSAPTAPAATGTGSP